MNKEKCAYCGEKIYEDLVFIPKVGWVCEDCAIDFQADDKDEEYK